MFFVYMNGFVRIGHSRPLEQIDLHRMRPRDTVPSVKARFEPCWAAQRAKPNGKPSFLWAIIRLVRSRVILQGTVEVGNRISTLAGPLLLRQVILFVSDKTIDDNAGYYLSGGILVMAIAAGLTAAHSVTLCLQSNLNASAAVRSIVYEKTLHLPLAYKQVGARPSAAAVTSRPHS
jgi:hypothetical protein